ncbi:MAG: hypothetical protein EF811_02725 [Methanonatronarchaeia archaeon]|nr:MAG: hypothetical protein EF811_02725 [Methanonatronarchaeia archaeon]
MDNHTIGVGLLITGLLVSIGIFFTYGSGSAYVAPYNIGDEWRTVQGTADFYGEGTYQIEENTRDATDHYFLDEEGVTDTGIQYEEMMDKYKILVESDFFTYSDCPGIWRMRLINTETNSCYPESYCPSTKLAEEIPKKWGAEERTVNKKIAEGIYMSGEIWPTKKTMFISITEKIDESPDDRSISIYDDTYSYHVDTQELEVKLGYDFNFAEDDLKGELYIDGDTKKQFGFNEIEDQSITASVEPDGEREAEIVLYDTESNASDSAEFTVKTGSDIDSNESVNGEVTGIDAVYDDKNETLSVGVEVENIEGTTNLYFNVDGDTKYIEEYPSNGEYEKSFDLTKDQGEVETETELYSADGELLSSETQVVKTDTKTTNRDGKGGGGPGLNDSPNYLALSLLVVFGALGIGFIMLQKGGIER